MSLSSQIILAVILIWTFVYTVSYSVWTWKNKNRIGAAVIFIIAFSAVVLPVYSLFFREG